jgi:hypothetical protein
MRTSSQCPVCESPVLVEGRIVADGTESGSAERFYPRGIRLLTLRRSVQLTGRESFKACMQCGHVWNTLDASGLRELIDAAGTPEAKARIAAHAKGTGNAA